MMPARVETGFAEPTQRQDSRFLRCAHLTATAISSFFPACCGRDDAMEYKAPFLGVRIPESPEVAREWTIAKIIAGIRSRIA